MDLLYDYNSCNSNGSNNGNVCRLTNNKDGSRTQSFQYDVLNRLTSANAANWNQGYGYDPWGNLLHKTATGGDTPLDKTFTANTQLDTRSNHPPSNAVRP